KAVGHHAEKISPHLSFQWDNNLSTLTELPKEFCKALFIGSVERQADIAGPEWFGIRIVTPQQYQFVRDQARMHDAVSHRLWATVVYLAKGHGLQRSTKQTLIKGHRLPAVALKHQIRV